MRLSATQDLLNNPKQTNASAGIIVPSAARIVCVLNFRRDCHTKGTHVPTILVDKPVTLVGMGYTISSLSLVGAR